MTVDAAPAVQQTTHQRQPSLVPSETTKQPVEDDHTAPPASADIAVHPPQPRHRRSEEPQPRQQHRSPRPQHATTSPRIDRVAYEIPAYRNNHVETREIIIREPAASGPASATPPAPPRHRYDEQPPRIERTVVSREMHFANAAPRPARAPQSRMEVPAQSEPVIQVSIGRVEVRAVTPPPAAKSNPRRAPPP